MLQLSFEDIYEDMLEALDTSVDEPVFSKALGHVATSPEVVEFMIDLAHPEEFGDCRVLEPACGDARFLQAFSQKYGKHHEFVGVEINRKSVDQARKLVGDFATIMETDFLLYSPDQKFDIIVGNPPYGIVGDSSHYSIHSLKSRKEEYKKLTKTWKGKYNIYGAFIEKSVRLLNPGGKLVFVVPTTWMILDDFCLLRQFLNRHGRLTVFYLGNVFPKVNVSVVVLLFEKGKAGIRLYDLRNSFGKSSDVRLVSCVDKSVYGGEMVRFESEKWLSFESSGVPIRNAFQIHFAARSPEFRNSGLIKDAPSDGLVPVLTGRNLKQGYIDYDSCFSGWWMRAEDAPSLRSFYKVPHLVVGHTKGLKMVCAFDNRCYPWREEYHLIPKNDVFVDWFALERYLNSDIVQDYLCDVYRDISPHLTKSVLQKIPVPSNLFSRRLDICEGCGV